MTKALNNLNNSSSSDTLDIPTKILKSCSEIMSPFLTKLFNDCIERGEFPYYLKTAIAIPLFKKKGDRSNMTNYRSISILPPLVKIFERLLAEQMRLFFEINKLFYD